MEEREDFFLQCHKNDCFMYLQKSILHLFLLNTMSVMIYLLIVEFFDLDI
jgi:hypothetical protein